MILGGWLGAFLITNWQKLEVGTAVVTENVPPKVVGEPKVKVAVVLLPAYEPINKVPFETQASKTHPIPPI